MRISVIDLHASKLPQVKARQNYASICWVADILKTFRVSEANKSDRKTSNGDEGDDNRDRTKTTESKFWLPGWDIVVYAFGLALYEAFFMKVYKVPINFLARNHLSFDFLRYCGFILIKKILPSETNVQLKFDMQLMPCLFLNILFREILLAHELKQI